MKARLYERYVKEVVPALKEKRKYTNVHQVPRMEKIVVNMGVSASLEKGAIDDAAKDLSLITGRKPVISKSRKSIANFKLREGQPIGCRVTLRRDAMYEFFEDRKSTRLNSIHSQISYAVFCLKKKKHRGAEQYSGGAGPGLSVRGHRRADIKLRDVQS